MYNSYNYMYQYLYFSMYDPKKHKNTHINVCIHKYKYSYMCNYVLSSDQSPLLLVTNKKSSETLSALAYLSNKPLSYIICIVVFTAL